MHTPVGGGVPDAPPRRTPNFPQLLTGSFAIASDAFPFPRKSAARDPAAAVMGPLKIDPLFPVGRDTPSAPVPPVPLVCVRRDDFRSRLREGQSPSPTHHKETHRTS